MNNPDVTVEVRFVASLLSEEMPVSYWDIDYLEEVVKEAIADAMYDIGCTQVDRILVDVETNPN
jgi:hypothetical protein